MYFLLKRKTYVKEVTNCRQNQMILWHVCLVLLHIKAIFGKENYVKNLPEIEQFNKLRSHPNRYPVFCQSDKIHMLLSDNK